VAVLLTFPPFDASAALADATRFTSAAILLLGLVIVMRAPRSIVARLFGLTAFVTAGWLAAFGSMFIAADAVEALRWARLGTLFAAVIPAAIFHFCVAYIGERQKHGLEVIGVWIASALFAFLAAGTAVLTAGVRQYRWGFYPKGSPLNGLWIVIVGVIFLMSLRVLWLAARRDDGRERQAARALLAALIATLFSFTDFLPSIGIDIFPIGFIALFAFALIAGWAVWRYHLVDLTPAYAAGQILSTMKGVVVVVDLAGRIRVANRAAAAMLGHDEQTLVGKHMRTILAPDERISTGRIVHTAGTLEQSMRWRAADDRIIDVAVSSSYVRDAENNPVGVVYAASDVTERRRAEQQLRESEERYRKLFDSNPMPMWVYDFETLRFIDVNQSAVRHYGYSREEFLGMTIAQIRPADELPRMREALEQAMPHNEGKIFRHQKKDGTVLETEVTSFEFESAGRRARLVIAVDVTERRRAEQRLRESEERYRLLFERNLAGVFRTTLEGHILECNEALARTFGYESPAELVAQPAANVYEQSEDRQRLMSRLKEQRVLSNIEVRMRRRDGTPIWVLENMTLLDGDIIEGTIIDITDRKTAQEQMEYQAYHDVLTDLPNRLLFRDRIGVALAHAKRHRTSAAVMFLDLDQFKIVNDSLGHTVGDSLLRAAGARLVTSVRAHDTVARMGGDEFTILLSDVNGSSDAATVAQKLLDAVSHPIIVDGHELFVTTSIGIALFPEDGGDAETLLKNADRAMYHAKEQGRNNYQFASVAALEETTGRLSLERSLHHAFERKEFVLHYQPMINLSTGSTIGAEALIRWNHPERGQMLPDEFIPVAEECGLIHPIGEWVLRTACEQMRRWHRSGRSDLRLAVNLSPRQFQQHNLSGMIEGVLRETGYPAELLDIEITETTAMQHAEMSLGVMLRLKEMGIRICIDDFGTGYSSLSYLKRFPIDTLKIDQNFVRDLNSGSATSAGAIVSAVISMARALKLNVIAEGVENEEQLDFLRRENCQAVQGFLCSAPLPADEFEMTLRAFSR
jgi:diguanylate cyclase (GGDEF)-like protein/PAS domain S-box-containing protein